MKDRNKGSISFGTFLMLFITVAVIGGLAYVLPRLGSDSAVDLSRLNTDGILSLIRPGPDSGTEDIPIYSDTTREQQETTFTPVPSEAPAATPVPEKGGSFTLTVGGTVAVEDAVRKSAYLNDSKSYDFSDHLSLLKNQLDGDINAVFFENLLMDDQKVSNLVIPSSGAEMPAKAGFDTVLTGFPKALDKGNEGLTQTLQALKNSGLSTVGTYQDIAEAGGIIKTVNGVRVAMLQFTANLSDNSKKALRKTGENWMLPQAEEQTISAAVTAVRDAGADVVAVFIHWGNDGNKSPGQKQKKLAQFIAECGADLIIGTGSRMVQTAEYLTVSRENGTFRNVFCAWSLGTLLAESRNANRTAGILLKLDIHCDADRNVSIRTVEYIPTWIWQYKQDSVTYYRTIPADRDTPDGMTDADQKAMDKAATLIRDVMKGSPVALKEP